MGGPHTAVPEVVETDLKESIYARTDQLQSLRELGPPDLCHLLKVNPKTPGKETGTYHHVTGVDASSSASLAAYINTLTYTIGEHQIWFGKPQSWKITTGIYCCYNAFSRVDMRVKVSFPGSVDAYAIDERGEKKPCTEQLWLETYLCSVLRALQSADEPMNKVVALRKFNPITTTESEHRFLDAAERLFFNGWQLGSDPEVQVPNVVSNHLTTGLLKYIHTTGRFASGINLFEKLRAREPEIASLLAKVYIDADEEVKAVQLLYDTVKILPMESSLLDVQAEFCMSKGRYDLALECAKRAVNSAPSEFTTWERLAMVYLKLEQYELALLTLNSCPMFTYQDRDAPKMPMPSKIHLPILAECALDEMSDVNYNPKEEPADPTLLKLPASNLKGTFARAYKILTEITKEIGWDALLKYRSSVFVMEEEYRQEKAGSVRAPPEKPRDASIDSNANGIIENGTEPNPNSDDGEKKGESETNGEPASPIEKAAAEAADSAAEQLEKPDDAVTPEVVKANSDDIPETPSANPEKYERLQNKRLCERWLDNLFMVLYEDLRVYTIWRAEYSQYKSQAIPYKKSPTEWEILGELALRLHHTQEALEAFQSTLKLRFSPIALRGVLKHQEQIREHRGALNSIIKLTAWQYRWYSEFSGELLLSVRRLIEEEGAVKVRSIVQATNWPQAVLDLTHHYAQLCAAFRTGGTDG